MIDHLASVQEIHPNSYPKADLHLHTTWTDGKNSSLEMYEAAIKCGLEKILFSEHARKESESWFSKFAAEIRALPKSKCQALVGVESKIESFSGDLDCTRGILNEADLVMASVHRFPGEKGVVQGFGDVDLNQVIDLEFKLAMSALDNPHVDILGHPFGMCYRRYHRLPPKEKMKELIKKAAQTGVAFEVNSHYHPNPKELIDWCRQAGARISLGSNAHAVSEVGHLMRILEGKEPAWNPSECS